MHLVRLNVRLEFSIGAGACARSVRRNRYNVTGHVSGCSTLLEMGACGDEFLFGAF